MKKATVKLLLGYVRARERAMRTARRCSYTGQLSAVGRHVHRARAANRNVVRTLRTL